MTLNQGAPMSYLENLTPNQVLHAIGLRREPESAVTDTVLPALAVFSAGILVGASIALLVTPKSGRELRGDISRRAGSLTDTVREKIPALRSNDSSSEQGSSYPGVTSTHTTGL